MPDLNTVTPLISALVGGLSFAVLFRTPKRYLPITAFIGCVAATVLRFCPKAWHIGFSTFITALVIGCLSHLIARRSRAPAQCFLIPGVIFLVPGTIIYRSFSAALASRAREAATLTFTAMTITLGISFGLLLATLLVPPRKTL